jgi:hypothetical protein
VTFDSNVVVRGAVVVQNNPPGTTAANIIRFDSNVKLYGIDALPATADFPAALRALKGSQILAPNFTVHCNSNFDAAGGSIVGGKVYLDSNAAGTIAGNVISLDNSTVEFYSNARVSIRPLPTLTPAGMLFTYSLSPLRGTYREVVN